MLKHRTKIKQLVVRILVAIEYRQLITRLVKPTSMTTKREVGISSPWFHKMNMWSCRVVPWRRLSILAGAWVFWRAIMGHGLKQLVVELLHQAALIKDFGITSRNFIKGLWKMRQAKIILKIAISAWTKAARITEQTTHTGIETQFTTAPPPKRREEAATPAPTTS